MNATAAPDSTISVLVYTGVRLLIDGALDPPAFNGRLVFDIDS